MMAHPLQPRRPHFPLQQPSYAEAPPMIAPPVTPAPLPGGFHPVHFAALIEMPGPAAGPCLTCRWATGDGRRFDCHRLIANRQTEGAGCAHWEREPGVEG